MTWDRIGKKFEESKEKWGGECPGWRLVPVQWGKWEISYGRWLNIFKEMIYIKMKFKYVLCE